MRKIKESVGYDNRAYNKKKFREIEAKVPSPAALESYEEISPGSASKIVDIAKNEQVHRHRLERRRLENLNKALTLSQFLFFALLAYGLYLSVQLAHWGAYLTISFIFLLFIVTQFLLFKRYYVRQKFYNNNKKRFIKREDRNKRKHF